MFCLLSTQKKERALEKFVCELACPIGFEKKCKHTGLSARQKAHLEINQVSSEATTK